MAARISADGSDERPSTGRFGGTHSCHRTAAIPGPGSIARLPRSVRETRHDQHRPTMTQRDGDLAIDDDAAEGVAQRGFDRRTQLRIDIQAFGHQRPAASPGSSQCLLVGHRVESRLQRREPRVECRQRSGRLRPARTGLRKCRLGRRKGLACSLELSLSAFIRLNRSVDRSGCRSQLRLDATGAGILFLAPGLRFRYAPIELAMPSPGTIQGFVLRLPCGNPCGTSLCLDQRARAQAVPLCGRVNERPLGVAQRRLHVRIELGNR